MAHVQYDAENPFDDGDDTNNPFSEKGEEDQFTPPQSAPPPLPNKSATVNAPYPPPKSSTSYGSPSNVDPNLLQRAERLRSKEEELNRREALLDSRTQILVDRENVLKNPREPNWPRCRPLLYHNIDGDMTEPSVKRLVRFAYFGWLAFLVAVLWNFICMFAAIIVDGAVGDFILSIVYCVFLPPIFFLIYRILYRAGRKTKPSLYIVFWIFYFLEMLLLCYFVVGYPSTGAGGIFWMSSAFSDDHNALGFMFLASAIVWGIVAGWSIFIFILSRYEYRKAGGLAQAKKEATAAAIKEAREHPDLIKEGVKASAKLAAENPELVAQGLKSTV